MTKEAFRKYIQLVARMFQVRESEVMPEAQKRRLNLTLRITWLSGIVSLMMAFFHLFITEGFLSATYLAFSMLWVLASLIIRSGSFFAGRVFAMVTGHFQIFSLMGMSGTMLPYAFFLITAETIPFLIFSLRRKIVLTVLVFFPQVLFFGLHMAWFTPSIAVGMAAASVISASTAWWFVNSLRRNEDKLKAAWLSAENIAESMYELAVTDYLTGISNRQKIDETLTSEINRAQRNGHPLTVVLMDIDNFKFINDTYGHVTGDVVIRDVAAFIRESLRPIDFAGRWGGEEFIIISPETNLKAAMGYTEKLRKRLEDARFEGPGKVTVSFGVAQWKNGELSNEIVSAADEMLYRAKHSGKNRVEGRTSSKKGKTRNAN